MIRQLRDRDPERLRPKRAGGGGGDECPDRRRAGARSLLAPVAANAERLTIAGPRALRAVPAVHSCFVAAIVRCATTRVLPPKRFSASHSGGRGGAQIPGCTAHHPRRCRRPARHARHAAAIRFHAMRTLRNWAYS
jgi:hypothetical protein